MTSKRKSIVPPAILLSFMIVGACAGIYGIIKPDIYVMLIALGWIVIGIILTFVSNLILNRGT